MMQEPFILINHKMLLVSQTEEPISNVTVRAQATKLVEFNDTAVLMCSVSNGSSPSYMWLNNSAKVMANGTSVQLKDGGAKLMMVGVTRNDMGPFRCNVSNDISYEISAPLSLNISCEFPHGFALCSSSRSARTYRNLHFASLDGPSNAKMTIMPMEHIYKTGSNITLTCSAESSPTASIQWKFNGVSMNHFTASHHQENVTVNSSGDYKCLFHNPVTSRFATASKKIQVVGELLLLSLYILFLIFFLHIYTNTYTCVYMCVCIYALIHICIYSTYTCLYCLDLRLD